MGRKSAVAILVLAALSVFGGGAFAASHYLITSTRQIKPSVLRQFQARLNAYEGKGALTTMCASGTDPTGQCEIGFSDARCPGRTTVMSGGYVGGTNPPVDATVGFTEPDPDGRGWNVIMANNASITGSFRAVAVCLGTPGHLARDARTHTPASVKAQISKEIARVRAEYRR